MLELFNFGIGHIQFQSRNSADGDSIFPFTVNAPYGSQPFFDFFHYDALAVRQATKVSCYVFHATILKPLSM
jgi:hypothetical protein